jgi:arylsulfatase A-like enzyme
MKRMYLNVHKKTSEILILLVLTTLVISCKPSISSLKPKRPNIILFLVDDLGWQDTSLPFADFKTPLNNKYNTPNMERLASQGMLFTQAYANSVCTPSRVSLISGMNAARHRVTNYTTNKDVDDQSASSSLLLPNWNCNGAQSIDTINRSINITALPQILKNNGYTTIHIGKAHFGAVGTPGENPLNFGFDVNIAGHGLGMPATYYGEENFGNNKEGKNKWAVPGLEKYHGKDINLTDALTIEAINEIENAVKNKQPFFLNFAHYGVHTPIQEHKKYLEAGLPEIEAKYASMIEGVDNSLGELLNYLDQKKLANNTIILFMSDNGGLSAHTRAKPLHTHNAPLKSGKGSAYEGGIRVPMIVKWPNVAKKAKRVDNQIIIEDFFTSILEMAQIKKYNTIQKVDGKSFVSILKGNIKNDNQRELIWHYPNIWGVNGPGIGETSTIRIGDFKLIYWYKDQSFELYNIKTDIGELNNLATSNPEKVKELAIRLGNYLKSVDAQRPSLKSTGKLIPFPDEIYR